MKSNFKSLSIRIFCLVLSAFGPSNYLNAAALNEESFAATKIELENKGVWTEIQPDVSKADVAERATFQQNVEAHYSDQSNKFLLKGLLFEASSELEKGLEFVPWSKLLKQQNEKVLESYGRIIEFKTDWLYRDRAIRSEKSVAEEYLVKYRQLYPYTNEYQVLRETYELAAESYTKKTIRELADASSAELVEAYKRTLELINYSASEYKPHCLEVLIKSEEYTSFTSVDDSFSMLKATKICRGSQNSSFPQLAEFDRLIRIKLSQFRRHIIEEFASQPPSIHLINEIELKLPEASLSAWAKERVVETLVDFHIARADKLSGVGSAAYLALAHAGRAEDLADSSSTKSVLLDIAARAKSTLKNMERINSEFVINLSPDVDRALFDFVRPAFSSAISNRSQSFINWNYSETSKMQSNSRVEFTKILYHSANDYIKPVYSSYYSHTIEVVNPRRVELESRIENAELTKETADRIHTQAIASHEAYPTDDKSEKIKDASRRYFMVKSAYDRLVDEYEATPLTIFKKVYEPYTYYEGDIKLGWEITAQVFDNEQSYLLSEQNIKSSFMRIGTHKQDVNKRHRVDFIPDFDFDLDEIVVPLKTTIEVVTDGLSAFVGSNMHIPMEDELETLELDYLNKLLHPWGPDYVDYSAFPLWLSENINKQSLDQQTQWNDIQITSRAPVRVTSVDEGLAKYQNSIVKIHSSETNGTGISSGVIIRKDGLILTTAHGIGSNTLKVDVLSGLNAGRYDSDVKFIDHTNDIAILAIQGSDDFNWVSVELNRVPDSGEKLLFITAPFGSAEDNTPSVIEGSLSVSDNQSWGSSRMVAQAENSSRLTGGAAISMRTGKLIGIVAAVSPPIYNGEIGSTGDQKTLLIPSTELADWLGLRH